MTGAELADARCRAGLSQAALGARVGLRRGAVSYWERKAWVKPHEHAPRLLLRELVALGAFAVFAVPNARAGARGGVLLDRLERTVERRLAEALAQAADRLARHRVLCEARTRKGTPCRALSEPGRRRCRFHGGRSTGPRTAEGKARIAAAQRRRWAQWREGR